MTTIQNLLDKPFFQDEFDLNTRDPDAFKRVARLQRDLELKHNKTLVIAEIKRFVEDALARNENVEVVRIVARRIGGTLQRLKKQRGGDRRSGHASLLLFRLKSRDSVGTRREGGGGGDNAGNSTTLTPSLVPNSPLAMLPQSPHVSDELDDLSDYLSGALKRHPDREERVTLQQCVKAEALRTRKVMNEDWNAEISYEMYLQNRRTVTRATNARLRWIFSLLLPSVGVNVALAIALFATIPLNTALLVACAVLFYLQAVGVCGASVWLGARARVFVCASINLLAGTTCAVVVSRGSASEDAGLGTGLALAQLTVGVAYASLVKDFLKATSLD